MLDTVVVISGGPKPAAHLLDTLPRAAPIIAADRGAEHALAHGLPVTLAIGDFDSISPHALEALERSGARLERHPREKDVTDLELALLAAVSLAPRRILVVGGATGRLDHLLGELVALGGEAFAAVEVDALLGRTAVHILRGERRVSGRSRELISLLALHGEATGVVSEGLVYPLRGETLRPGSTRGVSNLFAGAEARVMVDRGVLVAVRPGRRASLAEFTSARRSAEEGSVSS